MFDDLKRRMNKFWNDDRTLEQTDPEFVALFSNFAYDEVINDPGATHPDLDDRTRSMAIMAAIIGTGGLDAFEMMLPVSYSTGLDSVALKEIIYQSTAYVGFARMLPFLKKTNEYLNAENVQLPLASGATVNHDQRDQAGEDLQVAIFGEGMRGFASSGAEDRRHINRWLSANCFGDYYTRQGLSLREREMVTLCFLAGLGGTEPQMKAHTAGNIAIGNSREFLIAVISQIMPYIGYPRTLNALACLPDQQ
ncbi:carboxymuconolactone decarboxylase family protein [Bifidobacterium gallicum]|nr:carboxymuconolactone decarboxylase family protein [Bifidobacterium gallicum]KFI58700.1 carboxymuconolactone decarboxylase [Bifidobacterium gallicum DSM 20093 = LMG 11596]